MTTRGAGWQRLTRQWDGGRRQAVGNPRPQLLLAGSRSFQTLQEVVELYESSRREAEGAPSGADDAHKFVVLGGLNVMQSRVRALNEHLTTLLNHLTQNRGTELRVVNGVLRRREMSPGSGGVQNAGDAAASTTTTDDAGRRMMGIDGREERGHVGGNFEQNERRSDGVDSAQAELMQVRHAQFHGDVHKPFNIFTVRRVFSITRLRSIVVNASR